MRSSRLFPAFLSLALAGSSGSALKALGDERSKLHEAYFLEHQADDHVAARKLYEAVLASEPGPELARIAREGADRCRDHLAAADFATLMPPDAVAFIQFARPGQIIGKLADMVGLVGDDMQAALAQRPDADGSAPFHLPSKLMLSPALLKAFAGFGGMAVGLTQIDMNGGPPSGVIVLHHGDVDLLRGLLETAFQFSPTARKIAGMPTFGFQCPQFGRLSGVLTPSLLVIGTERKLVEGVVSRLTDRSKDSLASTEGLEEFTKERKDATLFAYCDLRAMIKLAQAKAQQEGSGDEFAIVDRVGDLKSLRWAALSLGLVQKEVSAKLSVHWADQQQCLVYNLLRLPPLGRKSLAMVPAGSAGLVALGLNPVQTQRALRAAGEVGDGRAVTGLDIGRELFGNITEICAFALPSSMNARNNRIPDAGLLLAVNDVTQSRTLWSQLLSLPSLFTGQTPKEPEEIEIAGVAATAFAIPNFGKAYLVELDGCLALSPSRKAISACIAAARDNKSILNDPAMIPTFEAMPRQSSLVVVGHLGRLAQSAAASNRELAMAAGPASKLMNETIAWAAMEQRPDQFTLQFSLKGLPDVNQLVSQFGPLINMAAGMAQVSQEPPAPNVKKKARVSRRSPRPTSDYED